MSTTKLILPFAAILLMAANPSSNSLNSSIAQNNNQFAFELFNEIAIAQQQNIFFSPFSISTALAMTYAGADSSTATEMKNALHFGKNTTQFHTLYGEYLKT